MSRDKHPSWPGLARLPTSSTERVIKIGPFGVQSNNQPRLPSARPVLEVLFTLDSREDVLMAFGVHQPDQPVLFDEVTSNAGAMFECAARKITGDANVKRS